MFDIKVAVVLSAYNGEKYIVEQMNSLLEQRWDKLSIIIRDDGSSDNTLHILESFRPISNITILATQGNFGAARSFFYLLEKAGNYFDYYMFCDQDDVWLPFKTQCAMQTLQNESQNIPLLYCSRLEYVTHDLNSIRLSRIPHRIGFGNAMIENIATGCTIVINKTARDLILARLPERCLMHDWWCYLVVSCFGKVVWDSDVTIKYRQHADNAIGAATSIVDDIRRRFRRFLISNNGIYRVSDQAMQFIDAYGDMISQHQRLALDWLVSGKSSFLTRIHLATSKKVWRQRWLDDIVFRILLLMNRY